jgi:hypothetical protein
MQSLEVLRQAVEGEIDLVYSVGKVVHLHLGETEVLEDHQPVGGMVAHQEAACH